MYKAICGNPENKIGEKGEIIMIIKQDFKMSLLVLTFVNGQLRKKLHF